MTALLSTGTLLQRLLPSPAAAPPADAADVQHLGSVTHAAWNFPAHCSLRQRHHHAHMHDGAVACARARFLSVRAYACRGAYEYTAVMAVAGLHENQLCALTITNMCMCM